MQSLIRVIENKRVLITGGTGSLGTAFLKAALTGQPRKIVLFSRDEQKHNRIRGELKDPRVRHFVGDVRDPQRLRLALRSIDIVIHAAAMKHVDLCEYNPIEAILTNVMGTANLIQAALDANVEKVIGVSTDKAVAPVNLYGATKLCMEKLLTSANAYAGDLRTRFACVRYGNVVGSNGSVVPLFLKQREQGRLTITDDRMTRFWIEMEGAVSLVLKALALMQGGEIFVPKLRAARVTELADALAPGLPQDVIGIRPGEKLHECLLAPEECRRTHERGDLLVIEPDHVSWPRNAVSSGTRVSEGYSYASDRNDLRLSPDDMRDLLRNVLGEGMAEMLTHRVA